MKKSLIAIAALAAVGAASAQSSVTLYGMADIGVAHSTVKTTATTGEKTKTTSFGFRSAQLNGPRLGVKGVEDLGNGLKATFQYELGFNSVTGGFSGGFNRKATVGLQGEFGHVRFGRDNTVADNLTGDLSADSLSSLGTTGTVATITGRANGVHYNGSFNGVKVAAFVGATRDDGNFTVKTKDAAGETEKASGNGYGVSLAYEQGNLLVGGAVQRFTTKASDTSPVSSSKSTRTEAVVGATYDFQVAKVYANYIHNRDKAETNVASTPASKASEYNLGVTVPFGAASFVAEYGHNRKDSGVVGDAARKLKSNDFMVGANYKFSKRTDVYTRFSRQAIATKSGVAPKAVTTTVAAGLRHRF